MAYFPSSQIVTGLKTNGDLYQLSTTGEPYAGDYWETSMGQKFSGLNANDPTAVLLVPIVDAIFSGDYDNTLDIQPKITRWTVSGKGYKIDRTENPASPPIGSYPKVTEENYKKGQFFRYFLKANNSNKYIEINKLLFDQYKNEEPTTQYPLYKNIKITWQLSGPLKEVETMNSKNVKFREKKDNLPGFYNFFHGQFTQFYKFNPGENLFTSGDEYRLVTTRQPYIGYYHIHPEKGAMVGKQHTTKKHDLLVPLVDAVKKMEANQVAKQEEDESFRVIQPTNTVRSRSDGNIPGTSYQGSRSGGIGNVGGGSVGGGSGGGSGGGY